MGKQLKLTEIANEGLLKRIIFRLLFSSLNKCISNITFMTWCEDYVNNLYKSELLLKILFERECL